MVIRVRKRVVYCDVHDVLAAYTFGMINRYGWPTRVYGSLQEMYAGMVDFDKHFKVSYHAPFLLGLQPTDLSQFGAWAVYAKPDATLVYVAEMKAGGLEELVTERWLRAHGFPPARLVCTGDISGKIDFLGKNAKFKDIIVDDKKEILEPMYNKGIPVVVAMETPWNRGVKAHRTVSGWRELSTWFIDDKWVARIDELREA